MQIKNMTSELLERNNLNHVYYFDKDNHCVKWNDCKSIEKSYWTDVFRNITSLFEIIVTENSRYLPKYGNNVIVILKSDEYACPVPKRSFWFGDVGRLVLRQRSAQVVSFQF